MAWRRCRIASIIPSPSQRSFKNYVGGNRKIYSNHLYQTSFSCWRSISTSERSHGQIFLSNLSQFPITTNVVKSLDEEKGFRDFIPFSRFTSICRSHGLQEENEIKDLASTLQRAAKLFLLERENGERVLYLNPENLLNHVGLLLRDETEEEKKAQLDSLRKELAVLDEKLKAIRVRSERSANLKIWGFICYVICQTSALARLTWWELSWDIIEPVTYFVTMSGVIACMIYVGWTKQEYSHQTFYYGLVAKKEMKLLKAENLSLNDRRDLLQKIQKLEKQLALPL